MTAKDFCGVELDLEALKLAKEAAGSGISKEDFKKFIEQYTKKTEAEDK